MTDFTAETDKNFTDMQNDLEKEMDSRFDHQNEVIDDISQVITTF